MHTTSVNSKLTDNNISASNQVSLRKYKENDNAKYSPNIKCIYKKITEEEIDDHLTLR